MGPFLTGFADELLKTAEELKDWDPPVDRRTPGEKRTAPSMPRNVKVKVKGRTEFTGPRPKGTPEAGARAIWDQSEITATENLPSVAEPKKQTPPTSVEMKGKRYGMPNTAIPKDELKVTGKPKGMLI